MGSTKRHRQRPPGYEPQPAGPTKFASVVTHPISHLRNGDIIGQAKSLAKVVTAWKEAEAESGVYARWVEELRPRRDRMHPSDQTAFDLADAEIRRARCRLLGLRSEDELTDWRRADDLQNAQCLLEKLRETYPEEELRKLAVASRYVAAADAEWFLVVEAAPSRPVGELLRGSHRSMSWGLPLNSLRVSVDSSGTSWSSSCRSPSR
jgi:hypothetical protein